MELFHALTDLKIADRFYQLVNPIHPNLSKLNMLISYTYFGDQEDTLIRLKREGKVLSTFLDAGTYGMNPDGMNPGLMDQYLVYLSWIFKVGHHFDYIASLDDRFNEPEHNWLNYHRLKAELKTHDELHGTRLAEKLVPVIHSPETNDANGEMTPAEEFLRYIQQGAKTIGIGSSPRLGDKSMPAITKLRNERGVRIHRFGNFDIRYIARWKIDSADSGRYFRSAQFGKDVFFWDSDRNKPIPVSIRTETLKPEYRTVLHDVFGWELDDLLVNVENIWMVNLFAHQKMQEFLTKTFAA